MELISTRRTATQVALTPTRQAVLARYGNKLAFLNKFVPANLKAIYDARNMSVDADAPIMVNVIKAYGEQQVAILLGLHIHKIMMYNGIDADKIDNEAVKEIASNIVLHDKFRTLNIAFALSYFKELELGKYDLYACKPINFMNALNKYCNEAHPKQDALYRERLKREREEQQAANLKDAVTYEGFCKMRGINPAVTPNPLQST